MDGTPEAMVPTGETIRFGPFRLYPERRVLVDHDTAVHLGNRALDILLLLVERAGEFVTNDEIVARVWPRTVVVEQNLRVHIAALRKALGDGRGGTRYIVNVPNRGYRFMAEVTREASPTCNTRRSTAGLQGPPSGALASDHRTQARHPVAGRADPTKAARHRRRRGRHRKDHGRRRRCIGAEGSGWVAVEQLPLRRPGAPGGPRACPERACRIARPDRRRGCDTQSHRVSARQGSAHRPGHLRAPGGGRREHRGGDLERRATCPCPCHQPRTLAGGRRMDPAAPGARPARRCAPRHREGSDGVRGDRALRRACIGIAFSVRIQ